MISKVIEKFKEEGLRGVIKAISTKLFPPRAKSANLCLRLTENRAGLEIGGPSQAFERSGFLPIYKAVDQMDNCNFSRSTVWNSESQTTDSFLYDDQKKPGRLFITEATTLSEIGDATYGFVASSHTLEHIANPLHALSEWIRVLSPGGTVILILPHGSQTFDHKRSVTPLDHLISDWEKGMEETDLTHLQEILELHDLEMDPEGGSIEQFTARSKKNFENRCLHHHVFDTNLLVKVLDFMKLEVLAVEEYAPFNIIGTARKPAGADVPENAPVLSWSRALESTFDPEKHVWIRT